MKNKKKVTTSLAVAFALALGGGAATIVSVSANESQAPEKVTIDFTKVASMDDLSMLSVGYDPSANNETYTDASWVTYAKDIDDMFNLTEDGLQVDKSAYSGDSVSENKIYVRYNVETMQYFEAELTYVYEDTASWGWAGFMFGYTNYERQACWGDSPNGAEFFVQNEGKGTFKASKFGEGYNEGATPSGWEMRDVAHTLKISVTVEGITFTADGTVVNTVSANDLALRGYEISDGSVGFMLTNAQFTVKSFSVQELEAGEVGGDEEEGEEVATYDEEYDFTEATDFDDVNMFSVGIDPCVDDPALGYNDQGYVTYARDMDEIFSLDNGLKVNTSVYSGDAAWDNRIYVRLNTKTLKYFEAELNYSYDDTSRNGWIGFILGYTNYERQARWGDSPYGAEFFVQKEGKGTYASSKLVAEYGEGGTPAGWVVNGEHTLKIVANEDGIQFIADGTIVNFLSTADLEAKSYELVDASVGFMITNAQFTVKSFKVTNLDKHTVCVDDDTNHECDVCGEPVGTHEAAEGTHVCEYCGERASDCVDSENDNKCDICGNAMHECVDGNNDHKCDTCNTPVSSCEDKDNNHVCDICGGEASKCDDGNNDHKCDVCNTTISDCKDDDKDHECDICGTELSQCGDANGDQGCDVCGNLVAQTYTEEYDFTSVSNIADITKFSAGIDPATNNETYTDQGWVTYAKALNELFTLDNGLKVNTNAYSGNDVSENNIYVRYNAKQLQYFKAELTYSYDNADRNGWAGFILGYTNYDRKARWGDSPNGLELFVQKEGKGTYSSAKLNNSNYTEGNTPAGWEAVGTHTLTVVAIESGITLYADGVKVISISAAEMAAKGYEMKFANIGFMLTNAQFTAKSFKLSPLDAQGNDYVMVEEVQVSGATEVNQFEAWELTTTVLPESAALKAVTYDLPAGAMEHDGKIYFTKPGTYTIRVVSVDQPTIYDEITVTVKANESYYAYDTSANGADNSFENYFVTSGGAKDGTMQPIESYWTYNADGTMTLTEKKGSGVDSGYVLLYLKDVINGLAVQSNSFELTYMVKSNNSQNGWHGVGLAMTDRATVPNQEGVSLFIQEDARKATIWGSGAGGIGGPTESDSLYAKNEWNMIKVRVYGDGIQKVEIYVNDMTTPVLETTGVNLPAASVALFTTTTVTIGNVYFAYLDNAGEAYKVVYPETVAITNAPTTAQVGDKVQLNATIAPSNASNKGLLFTSSNALVATVNAEGMINFLSAGTTTITVKCVGNPAIYDEITITVTEKDVLPTSVSFDNRPTTGIVGESCTLFVTVLPEEATNYDVVFVSSNEAVATVNANGRVSFVGAGTVTITVKCVADESITASLTITVSNPASSGDNGGNNNGGSNSGITDTTGTTDVETKSGCSNALGVAFVLPVLAGAFVALKKKKD